MTTCAAPCAATDRVVYGNLLSEGAQEVDAALERLRSFAEQQYALMGSGS
ncbi:MAG: hypothetical protein WKG07_48785 [Hymenobacter sp.]